MHWVYFTELVEFISHCWVLILLVFQRWGVDLAFLILLIKKNKKGDFVIQFQNNLQ